MNNMILYGRYLRGYRGNHETPEIKFTSYTHSVCRLYWCTRIRGLRNILYIVWSYRGNSKWSKVKRDNIYLYKDITLPFYRWTEHAVFEWLFSINAQLLMYINRAGAGNGSRARSESIKATFLCLFAYISLSRSYSYMYIGK